MPSYYPAGGTTVSMSTDLGSEIEIETSDTDLDIGIFKSINCEMQANWCIFI